MPFSSSRSIAMSATVESSLLMTNPIQSPTFGLPSTLPLRVASMMSYLTGSLPSLGNSTITESEQPSQASPYTVKSPFSFSSSLRCPLLTCLLSPHDIKVTAAMARPLINFPIYITFIFNIQPFELQTYEKKHNHTSLSVRKYNLP